MEAGVGFEPTTFRIWTWWAYRCPTLLYLTRLENWQGGKSRTAIGYATTTSHGLFSYRKGAIHIRQHLPVERITGLEPVTIAWRATMLPITLYPHIKRIAFVNLLNQAERTEKGLDIRANWQANSLIIYQRDIVSLLISSLPKRWVVDALTAFYGGFV